MLAKHRSKKQSETGDWVRDEESDHCLLCEVKFTLTKRRHHCRRCGKLVCGPCSSVKIHLDTSRSGGAKRVCTTCHAFILADEAPEPAAVAALADATEALALDPAAAAAGAGCDSAAVGATGGAGGGPSESEAAADVPEPVPGPPTAVKRPMLLPEVTAAESVAALSGGTSLEGEWTGVFQFNVVDIGMQRKDPTKLASYNAVAKPRRSSIMAASGHVREGSKVRISFTLANKGPSYLTGTLPAFGQFGRDGKVTGSIQRMSGKVALQFQIQNFGVTTSFNLGALLTAKGELVGSFSGCEMSKTSGTVSGVFRAGKAAADDASDESEPDEALVG